MNQNNSVERDKIIAEEIARLETKEIFESRKKSKANSLWRLLNSAFGLWFLSSILLSGITFYYDHLQAERKKSNTIDHLSIEMAERIDVYQVKIAFATNEDDLFEANKFLYPPSQLPEDTRVFVFPEFEHRSFLSLLREYWELSDGTQKSKSARLLNAMLGQGGSREFGVFRIFNWQAHQSSIPKEKRASKDIGTRRKENILSIVTEIEDLVSIRHFGK